ncbi:FAD-dependent monooxygenase (plasmid) [Streptomyces sp. BI20]|uniref:FAD-dependent monooxygenase n=1 Tax=Streptomyces sp. BI20 TaxID=3403460 RepID=UPI003C795F05
MPSSIAIIGGGPGGLFLARLVRQRLPRTTVRVYERNPRGTTFGFGVVFSGHCMDTLGESDPEVRELILAAGRSWTGMELRTPGGAGHAPTAVPLDGYAFTAVSRADLLDLLADRALAVGAEIHYATPAEPEELLDAHDLVVLANGSRSAHRDRHAAHFGHSVTLGEARYIWYGTTAPFDRVTFPFVRTPHGPFAAHAYPYTDTMGTFVVETTPRALARAGLPTDVVVDEAMTSVVEEVFAEALGGHRLIANASQWTAFRTVVNERWTHGRVVLLGDSAHTAHFSVGSGTKLAMNDAIGLARALAEEADPAAALSRYEAERRPKTHRTQSLATRSMRWWERFGDLFDREPHRFALHFLSRVPAIGHPGLARLHPREVARAERAYHEEAERDTGLVGADRTHALAAPLALGKDLALRDRVGAVVGTPGDCERAGQALVLADWRSGSGPAGPAAWAEAFAAATARGAVPGVVLDADAGPDPLRAAARGGARVALVLEASEGVAAGARAWPADAAGTEGIVLVAGVDLTRVPVETWEEWVPRRAEAWRESGVRAAHLWVDDDAEPDPVGTLHRLVELSDRVRRTTGLPVFLTAPATAGLSATPGPPVDRASAGTLLHSALVSGRADAIVLPPR